MPIPAGPPFCGRHPILLFKNLPFLFPLLHADPLLRSPSVPVITPPQTGDISVPPQKVILFFTVNVVCHQNRPHADIWLSHDCNDRIRPYVVVSFTPNSFLVPLNTLFFSFCPISLSAVEIRFSPPIRLAKAFHWTQLTDPGGEGFA